METPMPAAPAASPSQQQQSRIQPAQQLQQATQESIPPELEGLLRGMRESQNPSNRNTHMSWVRHKPDEY
ncbi:MAG: hypothetical protein DI628_06105 [Blastochloris viridis]|uniref:Uncharacterized protein n=1 Tax=Blastochloris viridis TaxID=1079 RepID=A0A6N4R3J0_BLAVI|nr:MAG: hypothetical protein DI628_06105 [Blastochloris viridis]